jgi:hypothetical protein
MCELVVTRFTDEAGDEEVVDPSVVHVLADDCNHTMSLVTTLTASVSSEFLNFSIIC